MYTQMHWTHNAWIFDKIQKAQVTRNVSWNYAIDELGVARYTRDDDDGDDDDDNYDDNDDDYHFPGMVTSRESIKCQSAKSHNVTAKPIRYFKCTNVLWEC